MCSGHGTWLRIVIEIGKKEASESSTMTHSIRLLLVSLIETVRRCVGNQCAQRLATTESDAFPLLLILTRSRGSLELLEIIEGKSTPSEVLLNLIQCHESFNEQRLRDTEEEVAREQREELKRQQEDEYRRSLAADLEKERLRQDDERKQREQQDADQRLQQQRLVSSIDACRGLTRRRIVLVATATRMPGSSTGRAERNREERHSHQNTLARWRCCADATISNQWQSASKCFSSKSIRLSMVIRSNLDAFRLPNKSRSNGWRIQIVNDLSQTWCKCLQECVSQVCISFFSLSS